MPTPPSPPPAPPPPPAAAAPEEHRFPCDRCGANMRYAPGQAAMVCDHCGNTKPIEGAAPRALAIREIDFAAALRADLPEAEMEETRVLHCTNCGADVEFDATNHATECPFCASPIVTDTGISRHIKPRALLPFRLTEREARGAMARWLGRLWFAPNGLQEYARKGRQMQGIYVPFWTFDADTKSRYTGQRGTIYYVTETVRVMVDGKPQMQTRQVQKIRWTPVSGRVARFFDDVLVLASKALPKRYTDALAPWDLAELEPYAPEFLAGFRAEAYGVGLEEGFVEARQIIDRTIERDVKFDIGGDRQQIGSVETAISEVTFKHVLLPVWLAAYKYRGQTYRFVVNGQSGAVQGERPWSGWKIALAVILGLIVAGIIGYLAAQN